MPENEVARWFAYAGFSAVGITAVVFLIGWFKHSFKKTTSKAEKYDKSLVDRVATLEEIVSGQNEKIERQEKVIRGYNTELHKLKEIAIEMNHAGELMANGLNRAKLEGVNGEIHQAIEIHCQTKAAFEKWKR